MRRLTCMLLLCLAAPVFAALDLNTATVADLDALPGVGPSRAQAIVDYRSQHGAFKSVDELRNVKGIGDKTFAELKPLLSVGAVASSAPSPSAPAASSTTEPTAAPAATGGFPWWMVGLALVLAVAAFMFMRRRPAVASSEPPVAPVPEAKPATAPPRPASSGQTSSAPPPRPAGAGSSGVSSHSEASAPPARPAGAPPRPAGSAPAATTAAPAADTSSSAPPKPAGGPPKPAGSR